MKSDIFISNNNDNTFDICLKYNRNNFLFTFR